MNKHQISETQTGGYRDNNLHGLTAAPHEVGLSDERLERISSTAQGFIDDEAARWSSHPYRPTWQGGSLRGIRYDGPIEAR